MASPPGLLWAGTARGADTPLSAILRRSVLLTWRGTRSNIAATWRSSVIQHLRFAARRPGPSFPGLAERAAGDVKYFAERVLIGAVDSPVSRISQSAASQIRVDHDQDRAAHHPVEGLDQVWLALRLGQRRPPWALRVTVEGAVCA